MQYGAPVFMRSLQAAVSFCEVGSVTSVLYLRPTSNLYPTVSISWPINVKLGRGDRHLMNLGSCESRENWHSESRVLLTAVNQLSLILEIFFRFRFS